MIQTLGGNTILQQRSKRTSFRSTRMTRARQRTTGTNIPHIMDVSHTNSISYVSDKDDNDSDFGKEYDIAVQGRENDIQLNSDDEGKAANTTDINISHIMDVDRTNSIIHVHI